jgi:hypothetical protein
MATVKRSLRCWFVAAVIIGAALSIAPAAPSWAASNGLWSVFPTTLPGHGPRAFVQPVLTPGKPYVDSVTVANYTAAPLTFHVYGSDAINTAGGGLSLRRRTDVQTDIGKWIALPYSELTVPARTSTEVPFSILTPPNATPGDHVGGIVAEEAQGTRSRAGSIPITVVQAVGVRIYGRVAGPLRPGLSLRQVSLSVKTSAVTQFGGTVGAHVGFTVVNSGNTVLSPLASIELTTPFDTAARRRFTMSQLLPGSSVPFALIFPGVTPYGHLRAEVSVTSPRATATGAATAWALPWALLAIILVVLLVFVVVIRNRRRRREKSQRQGLEGAEPQLKESTALLE